ncbi:MAG: 2-phosphosulfolactate phosphatase [Actinobacteria bacterium]|nr:2-phosphosulfolactate phosphatase [Actinomycetota bacterium]
MAAPDDALNVAIVDLTADPLPLADCVVAIDVIRAFTTAAFAFEYGASSITCVASIDQANRLRSAGEVDLLMGEERGQHIGGFDADNSALSLRRLDLAGVRLGQRTSNGTQGLTAAKADHLIAGAATTVGAIARYIAVLVADHAVRSVQIVCTGPQTSEDRHCAEHLADLVLGASPGPSELARHVREANDEHMSAWRRPRDKDEVAAFFADVDRCADVDRHNFVMVGLATAQGVVLRPVYC